MTICNINNKISSIIESSKSPMISYLSNRHYHSLTQLLPAHLRKCQPQKIYYKTFIDNEALKLYQQCKNTNYRNIGAQEYQSGMDKNTNSNVNVNKEKQKQKKQHIQNNHHIATWQQRSSDQGITSKKMRKKKDNTNMNKFNSCPICGEAHIAVQYHGYRHICVKCRNFVRDQHGNQIKIYLDQKGDIVCLGILPKSFQRDKVGYYVTDHSKLEVNNTGVYASYAGENQLVLILKDKKIC